MRRLPIVCNQVYTLFQEHPETVNDFAKMSQISQAEADKFYIEHFRIHKWRKTGIIWWNLLDGWPQISDAVVDYFFEKKLAFHYIKRSQNPILLMFDEPDGNRLPLYAANEFLEEKNVSFSVQNITKDILVIESEVTVDANSTKKIADLLYEDRCFYLISFISDGVEYKNHYYTGLFRISFQDYLRDLEKSGLNDFTF